MKRKKGFIRSNKLKIGDLRFIIQLNCQKLSFFLPIFRKKLFRKLPMLFCNAKWHPQHGCYFVTVHNQKHFTKHIKSVKFGDKRHRLPDMVLLARGNKFSPPTHRTAVLGAPLPLGPPPHHPTAVGLGVVLLALPTGLKTKRTQTPTWMQLLYYK